MVLALESGNYVSVYRHHLLTYELVIAYLTSLYLYLTSVGILYNLFFFF